MKLEQWNKIKENAQMEFTTYNGIRNIGNKNGNYILYVSDRYGIKELSYRNIKDINEID